MIANRGPAPATQAPVPSTSVRGQGTAAQAAEAMRTEVEQLGADIQAERNRNSEARRKRQTERDALVARLKGNRPQAALGSNHASIVPPAPQPRTASVAGDELSGGVSNGAPPAYQELWETESVGSEHEQATARSEVAEPTDDPDNMSIDEAFSCSLRTIEALQQLLTPVATGLEVPTRNVLKRAKTMARILRACGSKLHAAMVQDDPALARNEYSFASRLPSIGSQMRTLLKRALRTDEPQHLALASRQALGLLRNATSRLPNVQATPEITQ